jgi:HK97 family phage major capsid protein
MALATIDKDEIMEVKSSLKQVNTSLEKFHMESKQKIAEHAALSMSVSQTQDELGARLGAVEQLICKLDNEGGGVPIASAGLEIQSPFNMVVNGQKVRALGKNDRMSNHYPMSSGDDNEFSLSHYVKASLGLEKPRLAVTTGPALVPSFISNEIIDNVRANSVLIQAGALTIPLDGKTNLARIDTDPVVYLHDEAQEDIEESTPVFTPVEMNPRALVALLPITEELLQGSTNLDAALNAAIAGSMSVKLDSLGITAILNDGNIPDSLTDQTPATWAGVLAAVGSAMALNQQQPLAHISNPADFISRCQFYGDFGWLAKPAILEGMLELSTTSVPSGYGIFGDFSKSFAFGVLSDLKVEVIRFAKAKSYTHVLVCHLRAQGYVLQPGRLYVQSAITSSGP